MAGIKVVKFKLNLPQEITDKMIDRVKTLMIKEFINIVERIELNRLYNADKEAVDTKINIVKGNLPKKSPIVKP